MKKPGASSALLAPDANGWRLTVSGGSSQKFKTLGEAAAALPEDAPIHLALPAAAVLLERLTLPATDRDELEGMVQLQLEKTLPYPIEEVTNDFDIIRQEENQSTLISVATDNAQLDRLCQPLRDVLRLPKRVTLFAAHVAASCPADQTVLCLWQEDEQLVLAICENSKLGTAQTLPGTASELLQEELPALLLRAELEGVPLDFSLIRLEQNCEHLQPILTGHFEQPIEIISFAAGLPEAAGNLLPRAWLSERKQLESAGRRRQQILLAAVVYLLLVASAFIYLAWIKVRVRKVDEELRKLGPQSVVLQAQKARWAAVQAAIDPSRYTIEILHLSQQNRPSNEVKFTLFDHNLTQFMIEGEAPSANMAIGYAEKLRAEPGLADFKLETPAPQILKDDRAKFRFFGKL